MKLNSKSANSVTILEANRIIPKTQHPSCKSVETRVRTGPNGPDGARASGCSAAPRTTETTGQPRKSLGGLHQQPRDHRSSARPNPDGDSPGLFNPDLK